MWSFYQILSFFAGGLIIAVLPPLGIVIIMYAEGLNKKKDDWFDKEKFWKSFFLMFVGLSQVYVGYYWISFINSYKFNKNIKFEESLQEKNISE
jgi:hypothetical protein